MMKNVIIPQNKRFIFIACALFTVPVSAQTFDNLNFDLTESAFVDGAVTGTTGYNIINDATGAKLTSDNGDLADLFITVTSSVPSGADGAFANVEFDSGGLVSNHGFANSFGNTYSGPTANNPGTLITQTIRFTFGSHLSITDFETDFRSLNTRGITWESSQLAYLQPDGSYFSSPPVVGDYLTWQAATDPEQGSPSEGWWLGASTGTVTGVGTDATSSGSSGSFENLTGTGGDSILTYDDVGLAAGTEIGGFEWTVYLYDTRGQDNNSSELSATQTFFELSGAVIPEPSSTLILGLGGMVFMIRRRR